MAMSMDVTLSVEAVCESQIQEVGLDGTEIYTHPLSMSDNLTKLAHKIDFSKDESEEKGKATSESDNAQPEEDDKGITPFQPSLWPWDSVRNKLKSALTEMSVLQDILTIAKQKKYMVLDAVSPDTPESKAGMHMLAKKKAFQAASATLLNGCEQLKRCQEALAKRSSQDFHQELLRVRQHWRLKKVGDKILGDLSYRSVGSRYWQSGTFEVTKSDTDVTDASEATLPVGSSLLQISIPSELEGVVCIQVAIKRLTDSTDLASAELNLPRRAVPVDAHWQRKLEAAQNVIFCKELFAQLSREAVQIKCKIPHMVVGNQIFSHLFPGVQLSISLCHFTDKDNKPSPPPPDNNPVLEHSLHQLLRRFHRASAYHPMPHPASGLLGVSKQRRLAGPAAYSRAQLLEMAHTESLLESIIKQAKHIVVRRRAMVVIDELARTIQDPQISSHWSNIGSASESTIKVNITSASYESLRTPFVLHIGVDSMKAICKDGRVIELSWEPQELRDLILSQIAQHHINSVHHLSKMMGWPVLSLHTPIGIGDMEPIGNALAIMIESPNGKRVLAIHSGPISGVRVSLQKCPRQPPPSVNRDEDAAVTDPKWTNLSSSFMKVHMDNIEGRNFVNKIEILMASLTGD